MDMQTAIATRNAAYQAWAACPEKRKAEKAALETALNQANRAVTALKRAAEATSAVDSPALQAAALAAQAARIAKIEREQAVRAARNLYHNAHEWPRCGENWPAGPRERAAQALLEEAGL
jgi:hypothetical protein